MIIRDIQSSILSNFFKQKIIVIYGPRQVGKTTLLNQLKQEMKYPSMNLLRYWYQEHDDFKH